MERPDWPVAQLIGTVLCVHVTMCSCALCLLMFRPEISDGLLIQQKLFMDFAVATSLGLVLALFSVGYLSERVQRIEFEGSHKEVMDYKVLMAAKGFVAVTG
eukprot:Skav221629  [mRNA]  locus=scaffold2627:21030:21335:+ [translate_table: standard]